MINKVTPDLNKARIAAVLSYNDLCDKINSNTHAFGEITIGTSDIAEEMDRLRNAVCILALAYIEGCDDYKNLDDVIPEIKSIA